jgi:hypothetical protein
MNIPHDYTALLVTTLINLEHHERRYDARDSPYLCGSPENLRDHVDRVSKCESACCVVYIYECEDSKEKTERKDIQSECATLYW